ncbi:MAG: DHH family phosphoesterase [bacterium]
MRRNTQFLVLSHESPDGDALGAQLGLTLSLNSIGKRAIPYLAEPFPWMYDFLPGKDLFIIDKLLPIKDQILFVLDCGDIARTGIRLIPGSSSSFIINIDHHLSNTHFGDINVVDTHVSSTSELVYQLIEKLNLPVTVDIAENIYTGILTDTGSFRYSNTTPSALHSAGKLISLGVKPEKISSSVYNRKSKSYYRLLKFALNKMEFYNNERIVVLMVTRTMLNKAQASLEDTEEFTSFPQSIIGVEVSIFMKELEEKFFKVSLRSRGKVNVARVAEQFGGGGHHNAAGMKMRGTMNYIKERLIEVIADLL